MHARIMALLLLCSLAFGTTATAQERFGTLTGKVTDQQGAAVPGVTVSTTNIATGEARLFVTDANGQYIAPDLNPGRYTVTFELTGFSKVERNDIAEDEVEKLKQSDLLESAFSEFASGSKPLYESLIGERDAYMAARLREEAAHTPSDEPRRVLVVIGAGHLKGLCTLLREQHEDPARTVAELAQTPPKARWPKWVAAGLVLLVFAAIAWAFHRNAALGTQALMAWILFTGGFAALGAVAAGSHPLSVAAAFVAAPIKPFRPGIPAGGISAMAEAWVRRPRVADFDSLREDIVHWTGWWKNRVARTLLNFILVSVGTLIGEYSAGFHIVKSLF